MINIGIIEDNKYLRESWEAIIEYDEDLNIVGSFATPEDALATGKISIADTLILDIGASGRAGIETVKMIREKYPRSKIVVAGVFEDDERLFDAVKAGAVGYLTKNVTPDEMTLAIKDVHQGASPITPDIARNILLHMSLPELQSKKEEALSARELELLERLATGKSYAATGKSFLLSVGEVQHQIRHIYGKVEAHNHS